jgi:hypothetical protein
MGYVDRDVQPGRSYAYRLIVHERDGSSTAVGPVMITAEPNWMRTTLGPFVRADAAAVELRYTLGPARSRVVLTVHDVRGRLVRSLVNRDVEPGRHAEVWDLLDARGWAVPRGIYLVQLKTDQSRVSRKLAVTRP